MKDINIHNWQAKFLKENKEVREITSAGLQRLDGMVNRVLLQRFLLLFEEIHGDLIEAGEEFPATELIGFLSQQMQEYAEDTGMDRR